MGSRAIEVIETFKELIIIGTRSVGSFGFVRGVHGFVRGVHGFARESTATLKDPCGLPWQVINLSNRLKSTQGLMAKP